MKHFREKLKTKNGYIVNPALETIEQYGLWEIADTLPEEEKISFANELIMSVTSNNFGTMGLLGYKDKNDIPDSWIDTIFTTWCQLLTTGNSRDIKSLYGLEQFLNLAYRYEKIFKTNEKFQDILSLMNSSLIESLTQQTKEFNEVLQEFWNKSN